MSTLQAAAAHLRVNAGEDSVTGIIDGVMVTLRLERRRHGKYDRWITIFEAALPAGYPVELHIRRHGLFDLATSGPLSDITVGDPEFDRTFCIVGAPVEVVRPMLDDLALRRWLLTRASPVLRITGGSVRIEYEAWDESPEQATLGLELAVRLSRSVRTATFAADAAAGPGGMVEGDGAYRPFPDDTALQRARSDREAAVGDVRAALSDQRRSSAMLNAFLTMMLVVLAIIIVLSRS